MIYGNGTDFPVKPCEGKNANVCVAEGCYNESCIKPVKLGCSETRHVFSEKDNILGSTPFCDCGKVRNQFFGQKTGTDEKPVTNFWSKIRSRVKIRSWSEVADAVLFLWFTLGLGLVTTVVVTAVVLISHLVWVALGWYLVPVLVVLLTAFYMWEEGW